MIDLERLNDKAAGIAAYIEYDDIPVNKNEVLRYSGISATAIAGMNSGKNDMIEALIKRCEACGKNCEFSFDPEAISKAHCPDDADYEGIDRLYEETAGLLREKLTYRLVYRQIRLDADESDLSVLEYFRSSKKLMKNLSGCKEAVIFAATIGAGIDMLIRRYERVEPARGLMLQAFGAERVESLCDRFNDEINEAAKKAGLNTRPRYSPGYGDLKLEVQPLMLELLNAEKRLGITLNESLLMTPSKSVTAIIGIERP